VSLRLVAGLGNPGPEYEGTRHNVGFEVLDRLARHEGLLFHHARGPAKASARSARSALQPRPGSEPQGLEGYDGPRAFRFAYGCDPEVLLVKPETFMNRSGDVIVPLVRWSGVPAERVFVVYDDIDLPLGGLRIRPHGGAGGHNGMRSIIEGLGTDRFPRLRVGIGRPTTDAARHVLARFDERERVEVDISIAEASEAVLDWLLTGDLEGCMTRFHSRWKQESPRPAGS
jgi:PTH1 family peptidyl-tRNA hydrolase